MNLSFSHNQSSEKLEEFVISFFFFINTMQSRYITISTAKFKDIIGYSSGEINFIYLWELISTHIFLPLHYISYLFFIFELKKENQEIKINGDEGK